MQTSNALIKKENEFLLDFKNAEAIIDKCKNKATKKVKR